MYMLEFDAAPTIHCSVVGDKWNSMMRLGIRDMFFC